MSNPVSSKVNSCEGSVIATCVLWILQDGGIFENLLCFNECKSPQLKYIRKCTNTGTERIIQGIRKYSD